MYWRDLLNVQDVEKGFFAPPIPTGYLILKRMSLNDIYKEKTQI